MTRSTRNILTAALVLIMVAIFAGSAGAVLSESLATFGVNTEIAVWDTFEWGDNHSAVAVIDYDDLWLVGVDLDPYGDAYMYFFMDFLTGELWVTTPQMSTWQMY